MISHLTTIYYVAKVFVVLYEHIVRGRNRREYEADLRSIIQGIEQGATIDEKRDHARRLADLMSGVR